MPITRFLKDDALPPDLVRAMGIAFFCVCKRLRLSHAAADPATELVASKIIDLAQCGESDPENLCRRVLHEFGATG